MENNQSTYLTGLYITSDKIINEKKNLKTPSLTNELSISPDNDTYSTLPHQLDTRNQTVEFLKYSTYRTNLLKTEFLDYLFKEENYSNLNESEKFLREKAIENLSIINKNNSEIKQKKEEYKKIIQELNKELNNNIAIKPGLYNDDFEKKKKELQNKINLKKTDLNVLQSLYRKEYKTRYLLVQQQKAEVENIKVNMKQYEKYNILNKKISIEAIQKENLLNDVRNYVEQSREVFSQEIDNKKKTYNELEFEVLLLKRNTETIEKNLQKIIDNKDKVAELIKEKIEHNNKIIYKNASIKNYCLIRNIELLRNTEMNNIDLDSLIKNYNEIQNKMNKLRNDLFNTNLQIAYLNKTLHKLNDKYKEKKEQNNVLIKNNNKKNNKREVFEYNIEDINYYNKYKIANKINSTKKNNKELECICNTKSIIIILSFKFLFEYTKIIYKSFDNSKIDFNFNLDTLSNFFTNIMKSKYFELINCEQSIFKRYLMNDNEIFEEPNKLLLFAIQIFLNFYSAVKLITSNILNLTCYGNEDIMMKHPMSQFNNELITMKEDQTHFEIKKESNKVDIINFNSKENKKSYFQYLNQSANFLSQKHSILSRSVNDILQNRNFSKIKSAKDGMETHYPTKVLTSFLNNKNTNTIIKNSNYINNYPSTTLLSLKRFFGTENQDKIFHGFKSADKNKKNDNTRYTNSKDLEKTTDISNRLNIKNKSYRKSSKYKTNKIQNKKKEKIDLYLSKEYNYEFEVEEYLPKKLKKKNLNKNIRRLHIIKYSSEDPQKQLIFARMNDIRNLELFANNSNTKTTNTNEIQESKFYEMYDKFKMKYFGNQNKISGRNLNKIYKYNKNSLRNNSSSITSQSYTSNNNINMVKGMKFIRNNSDFFYGIKANKNEKTIEIKKLPYIKNNTIKRQHSSDIIDYREGSKETVFL